MMDDMYKLLSVEKIDPDTTTIVFLGCFFGLDEVQNRLIIRTLMVWQHLQPNWVFLRSSFDEAMAEKSSTLSKQQRDWVLSLPNIY